MRNKAAGGDILLNFFKEGTLIFLYFVNCISEALLKNEFFDL